VQTIRNEKSGELIKAYKTALKKDREKCESELSRGVRGQAMRVLIHTSIEKN